MDALCHRSLTDACRFAGVQSQRFQHNDLESLQQEIENRPPANRTLIFADAVFRWTGDICLLPQIIEIKRQFRCFLLVDDAHDTGVLGAHGRGVDEHFGLRQARLTSGQVHWPRQFPPPEDLLRFARACQFFATCVLTLHLFRCLEPGVRGGDPRRITYSRARA